MKLSVLLILLVIISSLIISSSAAQTKEDMFKKFLIEKQISPPKSNEEKERLRPIFEQWLKNQQRPVESVNQQPSRQINPINNSLNNALLSKEPIKNPAPNSNIRAPNMPNSNEPIPTKPIPTKPIINNQINGSGNNIARNLVKTPGSKEFSNNLSKAPRRLNPILNKRSDANIFKSNNHKISARINTGKNKDLGLRENDINRLKADPTKLKQGLDQLKRINELEKKGDAVQAEQIKKKYKDILPVIKERKKVTRKVKSSNFQQIKNKFSKKAQNHVLLLEKRKQRLDLDIEKSVFDISLNNITITKTQFVYKMSPEKLVGKGDLLLEIPKNIANSSDYIDFDPEPEIIESDPVIKWSFKNVPQNNPKEYAFTVDGDMQNFETLAAAAANDPSTLQKIYYYIRSFFS